MKMVHAHIENNRVIVRDAGYLSNRNIKIGDIIMIPGSPNTYYRVIRMERSKEGRKLTKRQQSREMDQKELIYLKRVRKNKLLYLEIYAQDERDNAIRGDIRQIFTELLKKMRSHKKIAIELEEEL